MTDLYQVLRNPSIENLHLHDIAYFNDLIAEYPEEYRQIITYINECFNYHSPLVVKEKDWGVFLRERFRANNLPEELRQPLMEYGSEIVVRAMDAFINHQKQPAFQTLLAKQDLRLSMLATMKSSSSSTTEKINANNSVTNLDFEINSIYESILQDQQKLGNSKGFEQVKSAKAKFKINISDYITNDTGN